MRKIDKEKYYNLKVPVSKLAIQEEEVYEAHYPKKCDDDISVEHSYIIYNKSHQCDGRYIFTKNGFKKAGFKPVLYSSIPFTLYCNIYESSIPVSIKNSIKKGYVLVIDLLQLQSKFDIKCKKQLNKVSRALAKFKREEEDAEKMINEIEKML